jgi:hypothetical protein
MSELNNKVSQILDLFKKGKDVNEVALLVGYSHPKSLSRFMSQNGYRWDSQQGNYVLNEQVDMQQEIIPEVIIQETELVTYDLLFEKFMDLVQMLDNNQSTKKVDRDLLNFWKKAQKYRRSSTYSIVKSFRITEEIEEKLAKFSRKTALTQKQIICMALDDFMEHYHSEAI